MGHSKVYGICENKCKVEVLPKENCCPKSHSSATSEYGVGTTTNFGHVKLTNALQGLDGTESNTALGAIAGYKLYHKFENYYTKFEVKNLLPSETEWVNLPLANGVTAGTTGRGRPQYKRVGNHVYIRGSVMVTPGTSTKTIGTIPNGFRPTENEYRLGVADGTRFAQMYMTADGDLKLDWVANITNGSHYVSNIWVVVAMDYYID